MTFILPSSKVGGYNMRANNQKEFCSLKLETSLALELSELANRSHFRIERKGRETA